MRKMVDSRIRNLIDMYYGQVVNLHHILSKTVKKSRPTVLSFYKNKLELGRKKRAKQVKRMIRSGLYDPVSLFLESAELTYCSYKDSEGILGNTYGMGIRQDSEGPSEAEKKLKYLKEELVDAFPAGPLVKKCCCTLEQGTAVMTLLNSILDKTSKSTRGSGKSDALGLALAGAVATGYSNIFVTATSPENLKTLFDFVCKGLDALDYKEHIDFDTVRSSNPEFKKATVRINIYKQHRQTIQYIQPHEHEKLSQVELLVIDEAVAIPLPVVKSLLGPHLIFLSSTINSYEGTDRSLSLELIEQLEQQSQTSATVACRRSITHLGRLIRTKSRQGTLELEEAFDYFNSMIQMQPMPSIWAFNHLLGALYKRNHHIIVVTMYNEMMALSGFHFQPDIRTMNMVIRCLCQLKRIDLCFSVLATAIKRGLKPDSCTLNTLLHGLCTREGSMDAAFELFSKMVDVEQTCDKITYGTMINGFCKAGETWKAVELLKHMYNYERIKLKPDAGCYCPIIHSLSKEGRVDEALSFCEDMLTHDVRPNVVVCNSLIHGLLESGRCEQATEFLQTMPIWEVSPNIVTYNTMLNALCKEKRIMEALDLVEEMSKRGLKPDCISYNCLISGFCRFGQWRKAMNLLHEMECRGVIPNAITFNIIVDALSKEGNIKEALNVFHLMTRRGVRPDIFTYSILLYGLSHAGLWKETSKLLDEMVSLESFPQTITINGILDAYSERGNMYIAEKLFDGMIQHGLKPDTITYNILLKGYGLLGQMDKARRLFEQMSSKGVEPDIFSYNALVIGYIKIDRTPAALELLEDVTRKGLAPDDVTRNCLKTIQAISFVANVHQAS